MLRLSGRFYAMDRDKRWQRVQKCYDAMVKGEGNKASSAIKAIEDSYQKEVFDEFVVANSYLQWGKTSCKNRRK